MVIDAGLVTAALFLGVLHALLLPTHWMPFVLVGRAQGWPVRYVLGVVAVAGLGHAVVTCAVGLSCAWLGKCLHPWVHEGEVPITIAVLTSFGLWFLWKARSHSDHAGHVHEVNLSDRTAAVSLILMLSLQPCAAAIALFLSTATLVSWGTIVTASLIMSGATVLIMMALTYATLTGMERLQLEWAEHYEKRVVGGVFLVLAALASVFHEALHEAMNHLHP